MLAELWQDFGEAVIEVKLSDVRTEGLAPASEKAWEAELGDAEVFHEFLDLEVAEKRDFFLSDMAEGVSFGQSVVGFDGSAESVGESAVEVEDESGIAHGKK